MNRSRKREKRRKKRKKVKMSRTYQFPKLRIDNPGACAREYNSIMQIIMEALIGWDFKEGKHSFFQDIW